MNQTIIDRVEAFKKDDPHAYARDIARALELTEAEVVSARVGAGVTPLDTRYAELYASLRELGTIKAMARNETAVIERWGAFEKMETQGTMAAVVGEEIDLRLFFHRWRQVFAVEERAANRRARYSLQSFDAHGTSIHKVYLEDESRLDAFRAIVERHRVDAPVASYAPEPPTAHERPDEEVDVVALRAAWDAMKDTHAFFGLLRRHQVTRTQALRLGGPGRAVPIAPESFETALVRASSTGLPIMIFVGNRGIIEIHTGPVRRVERRHGFLNVLDPRLNLHVDDEQLASAWVVRKPTIDGIVTSIEYFDARGSDVVMLFGKRKPGTPEDPRWRELVDALGDEHADAGWGTP